MRTHKEPKKKPKCLHCGRKMVEAYDSVAKRFTGYQWKCKCVPNKILSIG